MSLMLACALEDTARIGELAGLPKQKNIVCRKRLYFRQSESIALME